MPHPAHGWRGHRQTVRFRRCSVRVAPVTTSNGGDVRSAAVECAESRRREGSRRRPVRPAPAPAPSASRRRRASRAPARDRAISASVLSKSSQRRVCGRGASSNPANPAAVRGTGSSVMQRIYPAWAAGAPRSLPCVTFFLDRPLATFDCCRESRAWVRMTTDLPGGQVPDSRRRAISPAVAGEPLRFSPVRPKQPMQSTTPSKGETNACCSHGW